MHVGGTPNMLQHLFCCPMHGMVPSVHYLLIMNVSVSTSMLMHVLNYIIKRAFCYFEIEILSAFCCCTTLLFYVLLIWAL